MVGIEIEGMEGMNERDGEVGEVIGVGAECLDLEGGRGEDVRGREDAESEGRDTRCLANDRLQSSAGLISPSCIRRNVRNSRASD